MYAVKNVETGAIVSGEYHEKATAQQFSDSYNRYANATYVVIQK